MNTQQTVNDGYLMGIKEAREIKNELEADGIVLTSDVVHRLLQTEIELCAQFRGSEVADLYRGSRDFWKLQLKKLSN